MYKNANTQELRYLLSDLEKPKISGLKLIIEYQHFVVIVKQYVVVHFCDTI